MTTVVQLKRKVREIKRTLQPQEHKPDLIIYMWNVDDGSGKPGFCRFNLKTPDVRTPLTEQELKEHKLGKYAEHYSV